jgi:phage tail-like protein
MPTTGARVDPYVSFNFLVELDGIIQASFRECTGLEATTEVIDFRQGARRTCSSRLVFCCSGRTRAPTYL